MSVSVDSFMQAMAQPSPIPDQTSVVMAANNDSAQKPFTPAMEKQNTGKPDMWMQISGPMPASHWAG